MNVCLSLCSMLLNQFRTALVFFHWFKLRWLVMVVFIRSRICLLILPISDLAGLIRLQVGLLAKLGLWSLRVMKASRLAVVLTRSPRSSLLAISLASSLIELLVSGETLL